MSDTDDTDILLLIPPDFFQVKSSDSDDTFVETVRTVVKNRNIERNTVLNHLLYRVEGLSSRLDSIESSSLADFPSSREVSFRDSSSLGTPKISGHTFPQRRRRKLRNRARSLEYVNGRNELRLMPFKMNEEKESSVAPSERGEDAPMLTEIDDFLNRVDMFEKSFNPNYDNVYTSPAQMPASPKSCLQKYIFLTEDSPRKDNEMKKSLEELGKSPVIRKLEFPENKPSTSTPNRCAAPRSPTKIQEKAEIILDKHRRMMNNANAPKNESPSKDDSVSSSLLTSVNNNFNLLDSTCNNLDSTFESPIKYPLPTPMGFNMMSLADLWSTKGTKQDDNDVVTKQKFEEERLKREHCESIIQQLQRKNLEQQQKIAVAISIDRAKDDAIGKLKDAWLRLSNNLTVMDSKHKSIVERMTNEIRIMGLESRSSFDKAKHYEQELSKALDLAHDYQEKCKEVTQSTKLAVESAHGECKQYIDQLNEKEKLISELKDGHSSVLKLNKQFSICVEKLEISIEQEINKNVAITAELESTKKSANLLEDELLQTKESCDNLRHKLEEEKGNNDIQLQKRNESTSKASKLEAEVQSLKKQLESQKVDLKSFYQKQLEDAVLSKLKDFQSQLDEAEKIMANDLKDKQRSVAEAFAKQIQLLQLEHKKELLKMEETQKDEVKLYRLQLVQSSQKIVLLEEKLQTYRNKRGQIATQLHQVMESQWQQALRILTSGNTPSGSSNAVQVASRLNSVIPAELLNGHRSVEQKEIEDRLLSTHRSQSEPYLLPSVRPDQEHSRNRERRNQRRSDREFTTPISSKEEAPVYSDTDMRKYIKILLSRSLHELDSDNPQTDTTNKSDRYSPDSNGVDGEQPTRDRNDNRRQNGKSKDSQISNLEHGSNKRPWK